MGIVERKTFFGVKFFGICDGCGNECTYMAGYTTESNPRFYWQSNSGTIGLCDSCEKTGIENIRIEDINPSDCWCSLCKKQLTKNNVKFFCSTCKKTHPDSTHSFSICGEGNEFSFCAYCSTLRKRIKSNTEYWYRQSNSPTHLSYTCEEVKNRYGILPCVSGKHKYQFVCDYTKNESKVSNLPKKSPYPPELQVAFGLTQYDELFHHCGYTLFRCVNCGELARELPDWAEKKLQKNRI